MALVDVQLIEPFTPGEPITVIPNHDHEDIGRRIRWIVAHGYRIVGHDIEGQNQFDSVLRTWIPSFGGEVPFDYLARFADGE